MSLLSIVEIGILVSFIIFFVFWCREIKEMRLEIKAISVSTRKAVEIMKALHAENFKS